MTSSRVRHLFVASILILPLHVAYGKFADEPYPAIILPGFGASADVGKLVTTKELHLTVEFANKRPRPANITNVFPRVPDYRARRIVQKLAPSNGKVNVAPDVKSWLRENLETHFEGTPTALIVEWKETRHRRPLLKPVGTRALSTTRLRLDAREGRDP